MDWAFSLGQAVIAAVLGFVGGQVALLGGRRRDRRRRADLESHQPPAAAFGLEHVDGLTWSLVNVGGATASLVHVLPLDDGLEHWPPRPGPGQLSTATSELLPTLAPGEAVSVWLSQYEPGQRLIVGWTAPDNVRMGPVTLVVPAPR